MNKILIVRFSAMGDVAMLVPIIKALALQYPDMGIGFLTDAKIEGLFNSMPVNVKVIGADISGAHHRLWQLRQLMEDHNYYQFDALADMHDVIRSRAVARMFKAIKRPVATIDKGRWEKWKLVHLHHTEKMLKPTTERYVDVLRKLGLELNLPDNSIEASYHRTGIGIAPFAAHDSKIYPLKRMEKVVERLSQTGEKIFLFGGGHSERKVLHMWEEKFPNVECVAGKYTLSQELTIMQTLRVMITMDSSNMHFASLVGTRVVSIWGATHPAAGFLGYGQKLEDCVQKQVHCRPCSIFGDKPCRFGHQQCIQIPEEEIIRRVLQ